MVKTTFIIDDDEIYVYAITRLIDIKKLSEQVVVFKNGKQAIDYFTDNAIDDKVLPDVILLDVRMPIIDGWGFLEAFARFDFEGKDKVLIYMISSSIDTKDTDRAAKIPLVKQYLFKPVSLSDLIKIFSKN